MSHIDNVLLKLQSPRPRERYEACEELRVAPAINAAALAALEQALEDSDASVRERAQAALNTHRPEVRKITPPLVPPPSLPPDAPSLPRWVGLTTVGHGLGFAVGWAIGWSFFVFVTSYGDSPPSIWFFVIAGAVAGAIVGVVQWRAHPPDTTIRFRALWSAATAFAYAAGWTVFAYVDWLMWAAYEASYDAAAVWPMHLVGALAGAVSGLLLGAAAWYLLRHQLSRPFLWLIANSLTTAIAFGLALSWIPFRFFDWFGSGDFNQIFAAPLIIGPVYSLFLGSLAGALLGSIQRRLLLRLSQR
jgi:hypothetical protein